MSIDFKSRQRPGDPRKVRKWVHDECVPAKKELDTSRSPTCWDHCGKGPRAGLWCPSVPKEYGGMGLDQLADALVQMELGEHAGALSMNTGARRRLR